MIAFSQVNTWFFGASLIQKRAWKISLLAWNEADLLEYIYYFGHSLKTNSSLYIFCLIGVFLFCFVLFCFVLLFFQIGYSASSPQFSNKEKYPLYFRTATSETLENPARVALFKHFKWKRVALIVENFDIFVTVRIAGLL